MRVSPSRLARTAIALVAVGGLLSSPSAASTVTEAPANVVATPESARSIKVSWDAPSTPPVEVQLWLKGPTPGGDGQTRLPFEAPGTATETVLDGLVCGSTYEVWVAFSSGIPAIAGPITATTGQTTACTKPAPDPPQGLTITQVDPNRLTFGWSAGPIDTAGAIVRLTGPGRNDGQVLAPVVSYKSPILVCAEIYDFQVEWFNDEGVTSAPASIQGRAGDCSALGTPPAPPTGLRGTASRLDWVAFAWARPVDTTSIWLTRTDFSVPDGVNYREGALATFSTVGLACGTGYTLSVAWVDTIGRVSDRVYAGQPTEACPAPPPAPVPEQAVLGVQQKATPKVKRKPVVVLSRKVRISKFRLGRLRLRCRTTRPRCAGLLRLSRTKRKVRRTALPVSFGKKRYRAGTRTIKLHVRVPKKSFRALKRLRRVTVFATVTARDRAGDTSRKRIRITLLAPKKPKKRRR